MQEIFYDKNSKESGNKKRRKSKTNENMDEMSDIEIESATKKGKKKDLGSNQNQP